MRRAWVTCSAGLFAALFAIAPTPSFAEPRPFATTLDGQRIDLLDGRAAPATVLVFTATDCPVSNRYAPEVKRLQDRFASDGVRFVLVYANRHDEPAAIRAHLAKFEYTLDAVRDPDHEVVSFAHATISPEAVVFDRDGRQVYRGRIDDRFAAIGVDRQKATRRDLEEALSAVTEGRAVPTPVTQAVGCVLADFRR